MYKKIKRKDINKYYKCPICYNIVRQDNKYHKKNCKRIVLEYMKILDESKGGE